MGTDDNKTFKNEMLVPCPAENTGEHYGKLALYALALIAVVVWIFGLYVYGFIIQPMDALASNPLEPLVSEVSFDLIPALPDTLAEAYDVLRDEQIARIESFQWVDQAAGIASIPVEDAFEILIEQQSAGD